MAEEDSEQGQVATDPGENAQVAAGQDGEGQVVQGQEGDPKEPEKQVPFNQDPKIQEYVERQVGNVRQENELLRQRLQMMSNNGNGQTPPQDNGLPNIDDDDIVTGAQVKAMMSQVMNVVQDVQTRVSSPVPDLNDVIGQYDKMTGRFVSGGEPSPLQRTIDKNPTLRDDLDFMVKAAGPGGMARVERIAYNLAVHDPEYQKAKLAQNPEAQTRATENALQTIRQMPSVSQEGTGNLDKMAQVQAMSKDPAKLRARIDEITSGR